MDHHDKTPRWFMPLVYFLAFIGLAWVIGQFWTPGSGTELDSFY